MITNFLIQNDDRDQACLKISGSFFPIHVKIKQLTKLYPFLLFPSTLLRSTSDLNNQWNDPGFK